MKVVKNVIVPNTATPGKSTLTSLLTANNAAGVNKYAGRRIFMTKGPDGSTRVIAGSPGIITKGAQAVQQSLIKVQTTGGQTVQQIQIQQPVTTAATPTKQSDVPQRVQIMRTPDGRLTVKGLMPGQQLIQMPDGKLQVLCTTQIQQQTPASGAGTASATTISSGVVQKLIQQPSPTTAVVPTKTVIKSAITSAGKVIVQQQKNATVIAGVQQTQAQQQPLTQSPNKTQVVIKQQTPVLQKVNTPPGTVVVSGGQPVIQQQVVVSGQQVVTTSGGQQQVVTNQFIVPNQQVAQQLASGKLQIATINGQQVLIRPTGNGQAQVVAQITTGTITQTQQQTPQPQTTAAITPVKQLLQQQQSIQDQQTTTSAAVVTNQQQTSTATKSISVDNSIDPATMEQLLAGQPPGTVIKCVTAQVIQTQQGPRIVLQGLQGADFTPQQLAAVQQQVKQQLLKAQASTGKQGVLGPTKIYLAVQPPASSDTASESQPPPLAPVQHVNQMNHQQMAASATTTPVSVVTNMVKQQAINSAVTQTSEASSVREVLVNGQQSSALLQAMKVNMEASQQQHTGVIQQTTNATTLGGSNSVTTGISGGGSGGGNKQFVVTPDYIQQTIKTALKQENLNPEIEEKLLQLQRYQETKMKQEPIETIPVVPTRPVIQPTVTNTIRLPSRKRPPSLRDDDADWVMGMETPKRTRPMKTVLEIKKEALPIVQTDRTLSPRARVKIKDGQDEERTKIKTKAMVALFRHKEALKKDILRKRALLEKELQYEIQKEVAEELAARTKLERSKQDEVRTGSSKRKSTAIAPQTPAYTPAPRSSGRPKKKQQNQPSPPSNQHSLHNKLKKEKLYCICRTPYDETKFYVGCDLCNNWFHGDCVGITEESSKTMTEFICNECQQARDSQMLYCLCKQPYDESQFYICCDRCQNWFHGRCVGILQSEADSIDEYICPNCQKNSSVNFANMKDLTEKDFEGLRKLIRQIQTHKSAWPFMEPVDPTEAPDYYKVIKEPMDLQKIENKINDQRYVKLSEFIGDMTKIFDNCRYYNPRESPFFKCAESLEAYFVNKIKFLREKLSENSKS
ncbi:nucleosome-remodeling factor subunit NURF301 isoform X2 [Agrilus planipennis]|nr:nucleosome-remodeling factor subunit NURF301 isoform X2 [Agrilus planipennis]